MIGYSTLRNKLEEKRLYIGVSRRICDVKFALWPNIFTSVLTKFFHPSSSILAGHLQLRHE